MFFSVQGNHDRAIADFSEAIRVDPNSALAYYCRGMAYGKKGNLDKEIEDYGHSIHLDPNNATTYFDRALT